ncbi:MAG: hypothetical protein ACJ8AJ_10815, partial [Gemmatimonadaceae bacterium]
LGAIIVPSADTVEPKSYPSLIPNQVGRDFDRLIMRRSDLSEAMGASVADDEKNDVGPVVILDLKHDRPGRSRRRCGVVVVLDLNVPCAAGKGSSY